MLNITSNINNNKKNKIKIKIKKKQKKAVYNIIQQLDYVCLYLAKFGVIYY